MTQQGDVKLFQTDDGGDIEIENGVAVMSPGLETAAYLSLFGGNENDDGSDLSAFNWWGNLSEEQTSRQYRSETGHLLRAIPAVSSNLNKIVDAVERDLKWFEDENLASSITVEVSIIGLNRVKINIQIEANGDETSFSFVENWKAST